MKKIIVTMLIGCMTLSCVACGTSTPTPSTEAQVETKQEEPTTEPQAEEPQTEEQANLDEKVTIYLPFFSAEYDDINDFVTAQNQEDPDGEYEVYNDEYYSMVITEGERQEFLTLTADEKELNATFDEFLTSEDYGGAFTSYEYDEPFQHFKFYVNGEKYTENAITCNMNSMFTCMLLSQSVQAYQLVKPEDVVFEMQIIDETTGEVYYNTSDM